MKKKNNWFWNIIIILTLVVCLLAFVLHYKNWTKFEEGDFQIVSGIYKQRIPLNEIDGINFVPRIPELQRKNGFSWLAKEKGVFLDSISGSKVYVFVDDLAQQKLEIIHHDSLLIYLNMADSLETLKIFEEMNAYVELEKQNPE
ncbi:hypothetical protein [Croceivirga thetidis]|uniref:Bacterial Pleckstrin homology domain-containing protein n=1 Tax=Croceivirga thetidis TaxID=2721623 RepID=A0ABX1GLX8_9FLAO|nr:hypothetical protein [Croceivirga thetidis]NKI30920.1 hypothetical protein [Croceivirga thetidis]